MVLKKNRHNKTSPNTRASFSSHDTGLKIHSEKKKSGVVACSNNQTRFRACAPRALETTSSLALGAPSKVHCSVEGCLHTHTHGVGGVGEYARKLHTCRRRLGSPKLLHRFHNRVIITCVVFVTLGAPCERGKLKTNKKHVQSRFSSPFAQRSQKLETLDALRTLGRCYR